MKARNAKPLPDQEPVGIVISQGSRAEATPILFAYVWGPAPEPVNEGDPKAAA